MKRALALSALVLLVGCDAINPALQYQEAARQLQFSLDRVEPQIELAYPPGAVAPAPAPGRGRGQPHGPAPAHPARARGSAPDRPGWRTMPWAPSASRRAWIWPRRAGAPCGPKWCWATRICKSAWGPLTAAASRREPATWSLNGEARFEVLGIEFGVPFRTSKASGR